MTDLHDKFGSVRLDVIIVTHIHTENEQNTVHVQSNEERYGSNYELGAI